jgi:hypothetical protein
MSIAIERRYISMAPNSLYPSFVRIDYHSLYAAHVMLLPTLQWFPTSITGTMGSYAAHNTTPIDAEVMINALVDLMKPFFLASSVFDLATAYTMAAPTGAALPRATAPLTQVGTSASTQPDKATQQTISLRSLNGGKMKIVMLDAPVNSNFNKVRPSGFPGSVNAFIAELQASSNAWTARDGGQPGSPISVCYTLNEKLRREYGQA